MFMRIQEYDQCTPSPFSQLSDLMMCYETHHIHCSHSFPSIHNSAGEHSWIECKQLLNIMEWIQSQKVWELDQPNINHIKELTKDHIKGKQVKKNGAVLYSSSTSCMLLFLSRTICYIKMSQEEGSYSHGKIYTSAVQLLLVSIVCLTALSITPQYQPNYPCPKTLKLHQLIADVSIAVH